MLIDDWLSRTCVKLTSVLDLITERRLEWVVQTRLRRVRFEFVAGVFQAACASPSDCHSLIRGWCIQPTYACKGCHLGTCQDLQPSLRKEPKQMVQANEPMLKLEAFGTKHGNASIFASNVIQPACSTWCTLLLLKFALHTPFSFWRNKGCIRFVTFEAWGLSCMILIPPFWISSYTTEFLLELELYTLYIFKPRILEFI